MDSVFAAVPDMGAGLVKSTPAPEFAQEPTDRRAKFQLQFAPTQPFCTLANSKGHDHLRVVDPTIAGRGRCRNVELR